MDVIYLIYGFGLIVVVAFVYTVIRLSEEPHKNIDERSKKVARFQAVAKIIRPIIG